MVDLRALLKPISSCASSYLPIQSNVAADSALKPKPIINGCNIIPFCCSFLEISQAFPSQDSIPSVIRITIFLHFSLLPIKSFAHCSKA